MGRRENDPLRDWLTTSQAGERLNLTAEGVRRLIGRKRLPAVPTTRGWRLPTLAIEAMVQLRQHRE